MPKCNYVGNAKLDADLDAVKRIVRVTIVKGETERNVSRAQTIEMSGMSPANFYKAWNDPSLFRIGQLMRIYDFLRVPEPERRFT